MARQFNLRPDRPATIVVHPTSGVGDATTIADGVAMLAALSATGGSLLLREGTYSLTTTVTLPATTPISIFGCGNSTIISLGANVIAAFTTPTATAYTPVTISDLKVVGTEVADQIVLDYADANSVTEIFIDHVHTVGVQKTISVSNGTSASSTPGQDDPRFHLTYCRIRPIAGTGPTLNSSVILSNPSGVAYPRCWMHEVEFIGDSLFAIPGGRSEPLYGRIANSDWFGDVHLEQCEMSIGGDPVDLGYSGFAQFSATDCNIYNNDSTNTSINIESDGSFEGFNGGNVRGCAFKGIHFTCFENIEFSANQLLNCTLELYGRVTTVTNNDFFLSGTFPTGILTLDSKVVVIQVNNENMFISGNKFKFNPSPDYLIDIEAPSIITGNDFSDVRPSAHGAVFLDNSTCIIVGNKFPDVTTSGPPLKDDQGSNHYYGNSQLFNNGSNPAPVGVGVLPGGFSVIEGIRDWSGSSSGNPSNSILVDYFNPLGLAQTKGYIENTGANTITMNEDYITQNQGTFTRTTTLVAGAKAVLDPFDFTGLGGGIDPQVVRYKVKITGTTVSWHRYFSAPGGVWVD